MSLSVPEYRKYGLRFNDMLSYTNKRTHYGETRQKVLVDDALSRLSKRELAERDYRISRASQAYISRSYLPRDQWSDASQDDLTLFKHYKDCMDELQRDYQWRTDNV